MLELIRESFSARERDTRIKIRVATSGEPASFEQVIRLLAENEAFRAQWSEMLVSLPFAACRWECPGLSRSSARNAFECLFSDHAALAATSADSADFTEHFQTGLDTGVVDFPNLGGDARLVVPCPDRQSNTDYAHLLSFMRTGSAQQVQALWKRVGEVALKRIAEHPQWISTAGMGVYWLHVRFDNRPKYYEHAAYKRIACA